MLKNVLKKGALLFVVLCLAAAVGTPFAKPAYAGDTGVYEAEAAGNTLTGNAAATDSAVALGGEAGDWKQHLHGTTLEAEAPENILTGNASVADSPISSNGKKVTNLYQGSTLQFPAITVLAAGTYLLRIYYISGDIRPLYMKVNDGLDEMLDMPKTPNWSTLGSYDAEVALKAGSNTVTFSDHDWYSPDIDRIEIIPYAISYEAEDPDNTLGGSAAVTDSTNASGGKKVGYLNMGSSLAFNHITAAMTGDYRITVAYISGDPRGFNVSVNGGAPQYYDPPKTADWETVGTYDLTLPLTEGNNIITFSDGNGYSPDIDRIIAQPVGEQGGGDPGEDVGEMGSPLGNRSYGAVTVTDYTYGLSVSNGQYEVMYNTVTGYAGYQFTGGQKLTGVYSSLKLDGSLVESKGYTHHGISGEPAVIEDGFGKGIKLTLVHTTEGKPELRQTYKFYEDKAYFLTRLEAVSESGMQTNYMAPIAVKRTGGVDIGVSADNRVLTVPFDNDAWIRYKSQPINRTDTSYEVTAIFNNLSRSGLVIGSVTHDTWKTGIGWTGSANMMNELTVYGGAATDVTRDTQPHGSLSGTTLSSPEIMVGGFADYRTGLKAYGEANAVIRPPLALNPELPQGVPVGWNSWGAYGSSLSFQNVVDVSNYFKNHLQSFNNDGNVYINMDSYWDNLTDAQMAEAVSVIKGNDQHAGIYWSPFVYWGNNMSQPVEGTNNQYTYGDIVLKDAEGHALPTLDGAYAVDITHPAAKKRMDYYLDKFKAQGFTYIKLDFLTHGSLEGQHYDPQITTGIEAYNEGMRYINERLDGSMFISESIAPIFPSGYAHSRRISCDTYGKINETEYMLNSLTYGFWQSGTLYPYTDPDHMALSRATSLTEARSRLNSAVIAGTVLLDSDDVNDPKAQEYMTALYSNKDVLKLALKGKAFMPLEGNTGANAADSFVLKDGNDYYLAVFNYSGSASAEKTVDLARAGLRLAEVYTVTDLWTGEMSQATGSMELSLEPAESKLFKLTTPPDTGNPGNPDQPGVPRNIGNTGNTGSTNAGGTVAVTPEMLKTDTVTGRMIVNVTTGTQEVLLSSAAFGLLADRTLEVKSPQLSLQIPAAVLRQLQNKLPADERAASSISLRITSLGSSAGEAIAAVQAESPADVQLKGDIYEFSLSIAAKAGEAQSLTSFDPPLTLELAAADGFDPKQGGIYYIGENGKLEYAGGTYADGKVTAVIHHFSKYAVLELDWTFKDVSPAHWAYAAIHELAAKLLVQGNGDTSFEPGRAVTRAEFTAMLMHALGGSISGESITGLMSFSDVKPDAWYAEPVSMAYKAGIISGRGGNVFEPGAQITREEVAVMLMKAYVLKKGTLPPASADPVFSDHGLISPWAADAVHDAAALGLLQGQNQKLFAPQGIASRAEAAQVIYNLILKQDS